jgi:hypothetical protein
LGVIEVFNFTKFFVLIGLLVVMIFLSSPVILLNKVSEADHSGFLKLNWVSEGSIFGKILKRQFSPFLIVLINLGIITLLDYASVKENHESHSNY